MNLSRLLCVGLSPSNLPEKLAAHGYTSELKSDLTGLETLTTQFEMVLIDATLVEEISQPELERLYFLSNNSLLALCTTGPETLSPATARLLEKTTLECLYYSEIENGYFFKRIDRLLLYHRMDQGMRTLQQKLQEQSELREEILLRSRLIENERLLNANILTSITLGLIIFDMDGTVIMCNARARKLLRISATDLSGVHFKELLPVPLCTFMEKCQQPGRGRRGSETATKLRIHKVFVQISCHRFFNIEHRPGGHILLLQDISEQEATTRQLFRAEKLATIGTMLSGISHELRNPLAIISARSQRALSKIDGNTFWMVRTLESIETQAERCAGIVNNLLNFARQKATSMGTHTLEEILEETLSYVTYQNNFDAISLKKTYAPDLTVFGDRSRLVQIFLNIIINAADAMEGRGTLAITTEPGDGQAVLVHINDTGPGITPGIQKVIFDPFYTTKAPGKGTGLGLAIVTKILQESGGDIWVRSRPGSTTFTIKLPRMKGPPA